MSTIAFSKEGPTMTVRINGQVRGHVHKAHVLGYQAIISGIGSVYGMKLSDIRSKIERKLAEQDNPVGRFQDFLAQGATR